jgi:hypothetical protein
LAASGLPANATVDIAKQPAAAPKPNKETGRIRGTSNQYPFPDLQTILIQESRLQSDSGRRVAVQEAARESSTIAERTLTRFTTSRKLCSFSRRWT